jgi:hypothetical protein
VGSHPLSVALFHPAPLTSKLTIHLNIFSNIKRLFIQQKLKSGVDHPYFKKLSRENIEGWYAEVPLPCADGAHVITWLTGTPNGPTKEEEMFCRNIVSLKNAGWHSL